MAIRKIARLGHPVLRQRAAEVPPEQIGSPEIQLLIDDMIETMQEYNGVGLAAPQVHESLRLLVTADIYDPDDDNKLLLAARVLVNPEITFLTREEEAYWEGCLSVPDLRGSVSRPREISIKSHDRTGRKVEFEAAGFAATCAGASANTPSSSMLTCDRSYLQIGHPNHHHLLIASTSTPRRDSAISLLRNLNKPSNVALTTFLAEVLP